MGESSGEDRSRAFLTWERGKLRCWQSVAVRAKNSCSSGVRSGIGATVDAAVAAVDGSSLLVWRCRANAGRGAAGWGVSSAVLEVVNIAERKRAKALVGGGDILFNRLGGF